MINDGADVLMQNTDSSAVLQTAEKAGKHGFGWDSDMSKYGPHAHLGSAVIDWSPYYKKAVKDVLDGTWKTEQIWWGRQEWGDRSRKVFRCQLAVPDPPCKQKLDAVKKGLERRNVRDLEGAGDGSERQDAAEGRRDRRRQVPARDQLLREGRGRESRPRGK